MSTMPTPAVLANTRPAYERCPDCNAYAERRRPVLVPAFGRVMQRTGETAQQIIDRYFAGVHRRHMTGRPI